MTISNNLLSVHTEGSIQREKHSAQQRLLAAEAIAHSPASTSTTNSTLERSEAEQRETVIGLARFKISQGDVAGARRIADMQDIPYLDIGLTADGKLQTSGKERLVA